MIVNSQSHNLSYSFPEANTDFSKISWAEVPINEEGTTFVFSYPAWDIGRIGLRINHEDIDFKGQMTLSFQDSSDQEHSKTYESGSWDADSEGVSWFDIGSHVAAGEMQLTIKNDDIDNLGVIGYALEDVSNESGGPRFNLNMAIEAASYPKAKAYLFSMVWSFGILFLFLFLQHRIISYEKLFLIIYIVMGIIGFMVFPPFAEPDSGNHYRRAYAISEGDVLPELDEDNAIGGSFAWPSTWATGDTVGPSWYETKNRIGFKVKDPEREIYLTYTNIALYSPLCHIIPAIGMKLAGLFTNRLIFLEMAGRLLNYVLIGIVLYMGIRTIPFGKRYFLWAVTGPFLMKLYTSISPDIMTAALVWLLIAMTMRLRYDPDARVDRKHLVALYLVPFLLGQFKIVYVAFCMILFLIPMNKFAGKKKYGFHAMAIAVATIVPALIWFRISSNILRQGYAHTNAVNTGIAMNPKEYIPILLNTFLQKGDEYVRQFFGSILGVGEGINETIVLLYMLFVTAILGMELQKKLTYSLMSETKDRMDRKMVSLFVAAITVVTILIFTAEYVQWTDPGARIINGVSGRYFFPFIIPVAMLVTHMPETGRESTVVTIQEYRILFCLISFTLCFVAQLFLGYQL